MKTYIIKFKEVWSWTVQFGDSKMSSGPKFLLAYNLLSAQQAFYPQVRRHLSQPSVLVPDNITKKEEWEYWFFRRVLTRNFNDLECECVVQEGQ